MAFPATPLNVTVWAALGADLSAAPSTWSWTDVTAFVFAEPGIRINRGGRDGVPQAPPSTCEFWVDNADGRWVPTNPTGAWYGQLRKGTPVRIIVDEGTESVRWTGFLTSLPPRWDASENFRYVQVVASGKLQQLERGSTPVRSAMVGAVLSATEDDLPIVPVAYWPGEDGGDATEIAEHFGGRAMRVIGDVTLASDGPPGSGSLPEFTATGSVVGEVPPHAVTGRWNLLFLLNFPASPPAATVLLRWFTSGSLPRWQLVLSPGSPDTVELQGYDSAGVQQASATFDFQIGGLITPGSEPFGTWVIVEAKAFESDDLLIFSASVSNESGGTSGAGFIGSNRRAGAVTRIQVPADSKIDGMIAGHWAVWNAVTDFGVDPPAINGFAGDRVSDRADRLDVGSIWSDPVQVQMGPQSQVPYLAQVREVETASGGRLTEAMDPTDELLQLYTSDGITNQSPALVLDHDAGHVSIFEPTDDDQNLINDVTAIRTGGSGTGSSARVVATAGEHSRLTPDAVGTYDDNVSVNVEADADLIHQAGWRVNVGAVEGLRFPAITVNFARNPGLIDDWLGCDIASRVKVTNPPQGIAPDDIDLLIEGWTEVLGPYTWYVELFCSPWRPWHVFTLAQTSGDTGEFLGRLAGDEKAALRAALDSTTTGAVNFDPNFYRWTTTADDFPLNIRMGGEVVTLSGISTSTATFIGVGTPAHADNAAVTPALYVGHLERQLIVVVAAIRSSGTGTLQTPTGYIRLPIFGASDNVQVFAKVHTGTESDPTITPVDGSAGDTVSAFVFGLSSVPCTLGLADGTDLTDIVLDSVTQLNASAQNIAYGGLYQWRYPGSIQFIVGWKQDDYASVAVPSGFTELIEASSTTGSDQSLYCAYRIDTTPAVVNEGSLTVTGGASAISRSAVFALAGGIQVMTISTRSVNGVVKSHSAGTLIEVDDPGVLAL